MSGGGPASPARAAWLAPLALAVVALAPNPRAAVPGLTYYFRDFSLTYYPLRAFFAREAAQGRWPAWNPYLHEGAPALPMFYPLEAAHALWGTPAAVSWLLTLHLPLAALGLWALARELGAGRTGAFVAGAVYAMGGLALSALNLHWFLQSLALAPLVALTLRRAAARGGRAIPLAGLVLAVALSTLAVEFVAQAALLGVLLGLLAAPPRAGLARLALGLSLGCGLAALPLAVMAGVVADSARGAGLPHGLAMQNALHPLAALQLVVPDLFGSLAEPVRAWWSGRLFDQGAPYFLSLYVGPAALACAVVGASALRGRLRVALLGTAALGVWYALGAGAGLAPALSPLLRFFRYPIKALLLPYLVGALAAGLGCERLARGEGWRRLGGAAGVLGAASAALAACVALGHGALAAWLDVSPAAAAMLRSTVVRESLVSAVVAGSVLGLALAVARGRLPAATGAALLAALVVADVWRGGVGLNPQTSPAFFELLPELQAERLDELAGGRVFSYGAEHSPALRAFMRARGPGVDLWAFFAARQVLEPYNNLTDGIELAEGRDRLSFAPSPPLLAPEDYDPARVAAVLPRLRQAGVTRVLSLDPVSDPGLALRRSVPVGAPGLAVLVYELRETLPRAYVACRALAAGSRGEALARPFAAGFDARRDVVLEEAGQADCSSGTLLERRVAGAEESYRIESDGSGFLVTRDSFARGWTARVDGRPSRVLRADGRYRAVPVTAGRHEVLLRYDPPGFSVGLALSGLAALALLGLSVQPVLAGPPGRGGNETAPAPPA